MKRRPCPVYTWMGALFLPLALAGCGSRLPADALFVNGRVYTVDSGFAMASAFAVKDGRFIAVGGDEVAGRVEAERTVDLGGKPVYPGFIDAHAHFFGYSTDLVKCDLYGTASFGEVIDRVSAYAVTNRFPWILGRGWDQNDWAVRAYPDRQVLDSLFPDTPVFLMRVDGHAALVNRVALDLAGLGPASRIAGGLVEVKAGRCTGIVIDNAVDSVKKHIPVFSDELKAEALQRGEANCFAVGLTTVCDAGIDKEDIHLIDSLQRIGLLQIRDVAMVLYTPANAEHFLRHGPLVTERLRAAAFKMYADGALGSRGACLLQPYADQPGHYGFLLASPEELREAFRAAYRHGFQMCTHCIGDSANRLVLRSYGALLRGPNDRRWRIEHCQVVDPADRGLFAAYSIIPSVQPTHATSDMYWAESRLGPDRMAGAYAYKTLEREAGMVADGSDFPVESINPLFGFYAAVTRRDQKGYPQGGFRPEEALSREEALRAMTAWAAYAAHEDSLKGSIETGKMADFVVLGEDIMQAPAEHLFGIRVEATYVGGRPVFKARAAE